MDDSPRTSKRRKLDTPTRNAAGPVANGSTRRATGRTTARTTSIATEATEQTMTSTSTRRSQPSRRTASAAKPAASGTRTKGGRAADVYDDIEGALKNRNDRLHEVEPVAPVEPEVKVAPAPYKAKSRLADILNSPSKRKPDARLPNGITNTATRKARANGLVSGQRRRLSRDLVNGTTHNIELEADIQDELAEEASTPATRRRSNQGSIIARTSKAITPPKVAKTRGRTAREIPQDLPEQESVDELQTNGDSPTKARTARGSRISINTRRIATTPTSSSAPQSTVQDSEDDTGNHDLSDRTLSAKTRARRQSSRTDHISNHEDEIPEAEEDATAGADEDVDDISIMDSGSVMDPTEPSPFNQVREGSELKEELVSRAKNVSTLLHGKLELGRALDLLKSVVMERITAKRPVPLVGLDEEYKTVYQLIEHTITAGEGNSLLVIGARGSGKTALVNKVLSEISKDNSEDYHVVRLNGFIHTDDKIALREIWRQLGKEMDIEEDGGVGKNYADTLTTLLALLSHPSEQTGEYTEHVARAVVFIMDEFDLFATHPRQTLLYNLFDIAQSRKAPIAVLGLTTRIDVVNSLEKRVKSRFSHRYVHLSLAKTFTIFQEMCKSNMLVQSDHLSVEERSILTGSVPTTKKKGKKEAKQDLLADWNANMESLFASKSFLTGPLSTAFYHNKAIPNILTSFLLPTALLSPSHPSTRPSSLLQPPDSHLSVLPSLSTLAISLLIAAARLDIIHDADTCNFNMAYDEYVTLASKARIQSAAGGNSASSSLSKVWGKDVAKREWETLVELGLLMPIIMGQVGDFGMVKVDVSLEEVGGVIAGKGVDKGLERWCRQL
ncbi:origin recognition complex subunit 4 C-terminus-domain-containing protein [Lophiotrema nucula]|uniref:Origin recognition complex subunit 4 n=1 Tax=Lophiotrema nucula TaxID=690887 RepID=A0A6A5Z2Z2_9PLEO|nr:origin recognition complex subunit 4 C-terminus-domain-containing protein [Lophiotrema nucula]